MNDFEDWLNSLSTPTNPTTQSDSEEDSTPSADAESPSESAPLYRLSENDIEDVLDGYLVLEQLSVIPVDMSQPLILKI